MGAKEKLKRLRKRLPRKREEHGFSWVDEDGRPYYTLRQIPKPGGGYEMIEENLEESEEKGTQINADRRR